MFDALRKHLILLMLIGIPLSALTDVRPWPPAADTKVTVAESVQAPRSRPTVAHRRVADEPWFQATQQRLRAMGAVYVRLERWNTTSRPIYRFACDVAPDGSGSSSRRFEALSVSARAVTQRVLNDAEAWQRAAAALPASPNSRDPLPPRIDARSPWTFGSWR